MFETYAVSDTCAEPPAIGNTINVNSRFPSSNFSYIIGETVTYECIPDHYFSDNSSTWEITCELPGNWTEIPSQCTGMLLS